MGWQIIVLMAGAIFSFFTLLLQKDDPKNDEDKIKRVIKWCSLVLIIVGVVAACIDTFNKNASETVNAKNLATTLQNSDSALTRINCAIYTLDSVQKNGLVTIDSLKDVQHTAKAILDSMSRQLELQNNLTTISQSTAQKNQKILLKQNDLYTTSDRVLNPLFPLWVNIDLEIPFQSIPEFTKYVTDIKKILQDSGHVSDDSISIGYSFYNGKRIYDTIDIWFRERKRILWDEPLLSVNNYRISLVYKPKRPIFYFNELKNEQFMTFILGSDRQEVKVDFINKKCHFTLSFRNDKPWLDGGSTIRIGSNDLIDCVLIFNPYTRITDYKINRFQISPENGPSNILSLEIKESDYVSMRYHPIKNHAFPNEYQRCLLHKITREDFGIKVKVPKMLAK